MKNTLIAIFTLIFLIVIGFAVKIIFFPVNAYDKSIDMAYGVVDKTLDSDEAIKTYEWFKEQEAYIRQCYTNEEIAKEEWDVFLGSLPEDRTTWEAFDKREESSLRGSYFALQKLTNKALEDYNAKSSMTNKAIFKDNLPTSIDRAFLAANKLISQ